MRTFLIVSLLIFCTSCYKTPAKPTIDCGGCGLKDSGKKYENIEKNERKKTKK